MRWPLITVELQREQDVVLARQRARQLAALLQFDNQDQVRIATAVSEIARNARMYAKGGRVEFSLNVEDSLRRFQITVSDNGPGIKNLPDILDGVYKSQTGMGLGIVGAKRLMDSFEIDSAANRVKVTMTRDLPLTFGEVNREAVNKLSGELARLGVHDPLTELQAQNQELLGTLQELQRSQIELRQLNRELEDTNRGVVALYGELDHQADHLRSVSDIKTRFLSNMTHEFRTPVNAILSLCRLLLDRVDGELTPDQEKQIRFIQRASRDLSEFVNDLLDLAKVEAGKVSLRPSNFEVVDLFGALRGMLKPLVGTTPTVNLVIEDPVGIPALETDESKLSQILRNFIANALKYAEQGEVRVSASSLSEWPEPPGLRIFGGPDGGIPRRDDWVIFAVADAGIGMTRADLGKIFEEFTQVEGPHQSKSKGTGLGLPLSKKLAELLGGGVAVRSSPGAGSTFYVFLPTHFTGSLEGVYIAPHESPPENQLLPPRSATPSFLIVDDDEVSRYVLRGLLAELPYGVMECANPLDGLRMIRNENLAAVFLDILMPEMDGFSFLKRVKADPKTASIPIVIHSSKSLTDAELKVVEPHVVAILDKDHRDREASMALIRAALAKAGVPIPAQ